MINSQRFYIFYQISNCNDYYIGVFLNQLPFWFIDVYKSMTTIYDSSLIDFLENSKPKWVNFVLNIIWFNSLRLGSLLLFVIENTSQHLWYKDNLYFSLVKYLHIYMEASKSKKVKSNYILYRVYSLRLEGLHISVYFS